MLFYQCLILSTKKANLNFIDSIAIQDLDVISGSDPELQAPSGFTRLDHDLNKGSGGDYIYLCYSTSA
ncbi:hypothetical protein [uncultured Shewanella sp.]|uniref:hypothetical protein n=1 Tax=uncultured Shewanella sp. TaxID=173975 RepID=UPI002620045E|nr:hypothetical protein [uncultured Shewanella sp.]